jgi:hypothetical protein
MPWIWMAGFLWNGWQLSRGISGRLGLEYAVYSGDMGYALCRAHPFFAVNSRAARDALRARVAKETFERDKPHVNVGTIGSR